MVSCRPADLLVHLGDADALAAGAVKASQAALFGVFDDFSGGCFAGSTEGFVVGKLLR
jgi:hypothetical protein